MGSTHSSTSFSRLFRNGK